MLPANENTPKASGRRCPICGQPTAVEYKPFCSKRCADVDLHSWLSGRYAIPVVEDDRGIDDDAADSGREG